MLRSGIVVTGGSAQLPNLGSFINDMSGFKVRIGSPKKLFLSQGCDSLYETSAATSVGLILTACDSEEINCAHHTGISQHDAAETEIENAEGELFSQDQLGGVVVNDPKTVQTPAPAKPKAQKQKGVWKDKIGSLMGNIFDTVMNEVDSER